MTTCAAPDCTRTLRRENRTGYCQLHRNMAPVHRPTERPGTRKVTIAKPASSSRAETFVSVTLPKEPWS